MNKSKLSSKILKGIAWFGKSYLWIIPLLLLADVLSKLGLERLLLSKPGHAITVIPGFFRLALLYNEGAAWGLFEGMDWLLVTISALAGALMIGFLIWKYKTMPTYLKICLSLVIPGCLGNLIDRAFYPHGVIDFLEFTFGSYRFPTFNLADSYIVIGVILLVICEIVTEYRQSQTKAKEHVSHVKEEELTQAIKNFEKEAGDNRQPDKSETDGKTDTD